MDTARTYSLTVADILMWISFLVLRSSSHRWTSAKPRGEADTDPREMIFASFNSPILSFGFKYSTSWLVPQNSSFLNLERQIILTHLDINSTLTIIGLFFSSPVVISIPLPYQPQNPPHFRKHSPSSSISFPSLNIKHEQLHSDPQTCIYHITHCSNYSLLVHHCDISCSAVSLAVLVSGD